MTLWRKLGLAASALAAVAVLYTGAWFYVAHRLEQGIDRWATERRANGWIASYGGVAVTGFPLAWRAQLDAPRLAQQVREPGFFWAGPSLDLGWAPWRARCGWKVVRSSSTHRPRPSGWAWALYPRTENYRDCL